MRHMVYNVAAKPFDRHPVMPAKDDILYYRPLLSSEPFTNNHKVPIFNVADVGMVADILELLTKRTETNE